MVCTGINTKQINPTYNWYFIMGASLIKGGFLDSSVGKESACKAGDPVRFLGWEDPLEKDRLPTPVFLGFPVAQLVKNLPACSVGDPGWIPGLGRSLGEGKGYPLPYSGLENSMDCIVHGVTKNQTRLGDFHIHWKNNDFLHRTMLKILIKER